MKLNRMLKILLVIAASLGIALAAELTISLNSPTTFPLDI
jgi:hypothetical protein